MEDPKLSLVSQLYLNLCFLIFNIIFCSRFWPPIYINFATVVYKFFIFPSLLLNIYHSHLPTPLCFILSAVRSCQNGFHKLIFLSGGKQSDIFQYLLVNRFFGNLKWYKVALFYISIAQNLFMYQICSLSEEPFEHKMSIYD